MNKRAQRLGLIAMVLTLLVGCANVSPNSGASEESETSEKTVSLEANYEMKTSEEIEITQDYSFQIDNKTPYQELLTKTVDIHTFAQTFDMYGTGRGIDDVMEVIGVECLRKTSGGALYSIHKVEQGGLLYIFYNYEDKSAEIKTNEIRHWFYVMKRQSSAEIMDLKGKGATIEDVIKINGAEQIYLNCYSADPKIQSGEEGVLTTYHYFTDGILELRYYYIQGELVCVPYHLEINFGLRDRKDEESSPYKALIYGMDWVEN